jgi:hypothetical protein
MARRKRQASTFNLSFLDIMSCGFGAVVLVFLIIDHSLEVEIRTVNAEILSEVNLLEEDIREGEAGLVRLRNALDEADLEIVEADGLARRITEELDEYEALIASIEESGVSDTEAVEKLKAEIRKLEEEVKLLEEASAAESGRNARQFVGEGNRQYLTGLNLGGRRIVILVDTSASMLANQLVNVIRLRNMDPALQQQADKWVRALDTIDWLTAQLPVNAQFQVIAFNTEAAPVLEGTEGKWLDVADTPKLEAVSAALRARIPSGGTSLHQAFDALKTLPAPPDNIFLLTDGLPTQGDRPPRGSRVDGNQRLKLFREAIRRLPGGVPVNTILFPMEGDPMAASEYWQLAGASNGSFLSPSADWP